MQNKSTKESSKSKSNSRQGKRQKKTVAKNCEFLQTPWTMAVNKKARVALFVLKDKTWTEFCSVRAMRHQKTMKIDDNKTLQNVLILDGGEAPIVLYLKQYQQDKKFSSLEFSQLTEEELCSRVATMLNSQTTVPKSKKHVVEDDDDEDNENNDDDAIEEEEDNNTAGAKENARNNEDDNDTQENEETQQLDEGVNFVSDDEDNDDKRL